MATGSTADFRLTIADVLPLAGVGTVVFGPIESGVLHNGDEVEIWDDDRLVALATATLELIRRQGGDPRSIALRLAGIETGLLAAGQQVRRRASLS